jgi:hypothetical protein
MLVADPVWYRDVRALARRPGEFFPCRDHSPEERVNSVVRLLLYISLAVFLYARRAKYLLFGLGAVALVSLAYRGPAGARGHVLSSRPASTSGVRVRDVQRAKRQCTLSTPDNPFANMLLSDLADNPGRAPACKYDEHQDLIEANFNKGLVRNVYDVYDKENSQRQFMTMPVTTGIPDTVAFAKFCYGTAGRATCKDDPSKCTGAFP